MTETPKHSLQSVIDVKNYTFCVLKHGITASWTFKNKVTATEMLP
jgi:hypothetical protein